MVRLGKAHSRRGRRGVRLLALLLAAAVFLGGTFLVISLKIRPTMLQLAVSTVTDTVRMLVAGAIRSVLAERGEEYSDLVTLEKDDRGAVAALVTNMSRLNALQADITVEVLELLRGRGAAVIYIPLGNLTNIAILSGTGPEIPVRILSVTSVQTDFQNEFSSAGINQTRHRIVMSVNVCLTILIPGASADLTIPTLVPVAETVIVGEVPDTYADFAAPGRSEP